MTHIEEPAMAVRNVDEKTIYRLAQKDDHKSWIQERKKAAQKPGKVSKA